MDTGQAHARYRDLLYTRGHGHPLWIPEPGHTLPAQRIKGISIGDVGVLTDDGGFEYLWNVHLPANHPYNMDKVPPGFVPLSDLDEGRDLRKTPAFHPKNTTISTASIKKRNVDLKKALQSVIAERDAGFSFSVEGNSGAILILPRGAARVDAKRPVDYKQYAVSHAESWYRYINGKDQNRGVQSGALCLVTGTDKCSSWGVASFAKPSGSQSLTLSAVISGAATAEASIKSIYTDDFGVEFRTNVVDDSEDSQCVFLRGFVICVRDSLLARWLGTPPRVEPLPGAAALPSLVGSHRPFVRGAEADLHSVERSYGGSLQKSPAAVLGDRLLNAYRNASIAVIHDDDCKSSLGREDEAGYQRGGLEDEDNHAAPQSYIVVVDGVCTLIPEKPTSITLTGDSVTLDNAIASSLLHIQHHVSVAFPVTQVPLMADIERSKAEPTRSSVKQRLFALVIGINRYKHAGSVLHDLKGAVADADDMNNFLISLAVDPDHIHNLRDEQATRDGIINALKALSCDDRIKRNDAIVIFFAGHGSTTAVMGPHGARHIEMIVPHDFLPKTTSNLHQQGLLDTTLADLLTNLAKAKGNNITAIFDSCHAGSSTRDPSILSRGIVLPENYVVLSSALPSVFPLAEEKGDSRGAQVAAGYEYYGLASHVLLAACSREESAYEQNMRGRFTQELLSKLRTTNVAKLTYRSLMDHLDDLPGQHPQCEGRNIDRVLFDGKAPIGSYVMYSVKVTQDGAITLVGGGIHGIAKDAEFDIYATNDMNAQRLCRLVATVVDANSCVLAPVAEFAKPAIPQPAWALQATPGLRPKLGVVLRPEHKFLRVKDKLSENGVIHFGTGVQHELELEADGFDAVFVVANERCVRAGLKQLEKKYPIADTDKICSVLEAAADFFFHLRRANSHTRLARDVVIEAYQLQGSEIGDTNLVDGNEISLVIKQDQTIDCGFRLVNKGSRNLYLWVFLFNVRNLSIETMYAPGVAKSSVDYSLPAGKDLTIGYGGGEGPTYEFSLGGVDADVSYIKVYITSVAVNLSHIEMNSPFEERGDMRYGRKRIDEQLPQWDTILIPIVQEAAK